MRLGDVLVQRGIIDRKQLKETLDAQLIYGGRLGTCLVEKGFIDEPRLGALLAETLRAKCACGELLQGVPREVLDLVPPKLVEKYHAVPFRLENKVLHVAMIDPNDLLAIDEISFATGHKIQPWVAPEVRIVLAMERFYGVSRQQRYIAVLKRLDARVPKPAPRPPAPRRDHEDDGTVMSLERVGELLCGANSTDALAETVLGYGAHKTIRSILFRIYDGAAIVWKARGEDLDTEILRHTKIPLDSEPMFALAQGASHYQGALPDGEAYQEFYHRLWVKKPLEVVVYPIHLKGRLVAFFYRDGGPDERIPGSAEDYQRLIRKLTLGLGLLTIKRDIRAA